MALDERVRVIIDVVTDRANRGLSSFRSAVAQAEGATGKLRAGASNLGTQLGSYVGPAALAAGSALVAFGVKSVTAFQDTALAAGRFSEATGVAVEEGSRLLDVAGDIGIGGEQMTSSFARLNKALGEGSLKAWGIDADNATDGFLQVVEALKKIENPTQRALLAQQAFGRGYTQIAELTAMSAKDLREALDDVGEGQIIDQDELRKARELRENVDQLGDAWESFSLVLGETIAPIVADLADVVDGVVNVRDAVEEDTGFDLFGSLKDQVGDFLDEFRDPNPPWENIETKLNPAIGETVELLDSGRRGGSGFFGELEDGADDLLGPLKDLQQSLEDAADELERLFDAVPQSFDAEEAFLSLQVAVDGYRESLDDSTLSAEERRLKEIQLASEALTSAQAWATANGAVEKSAESAQIQIDMLTLLQGQYPELADEIQVYIDALNRIPRNVATTVTINGRPVSVSATGGGTTVGLLPAPRPGDIAQFDSGGVVGGPVGSEQLIMAHGGETVLPTHKSGFSTGGIYIAPGAIVVNGNASGEDIVNALVRYNRRNGTSWFG